MEIQFRDVIDSDLTIFLKHQSDPEANKIAAFFAQDRGAFMASHVLSSQSMANIKRTVWLTERHGLRICIVDIGQQ